MYKNPLPIDLRVAAAVKFWRTLSGYSQSGVARSMNCPRTYISKIENAHACPLFAQFIRLAEALDVSPYMLALTMEAFDVLPTPR
jgi:transcriptional regulator with XRE-family HTH domain